MKRDAPVVLDELGLAEEFSDFAYSVSHDLWGPAQAVVAFTRLLESEQSRAFSEDGQLYFSLIVDNGRKLQEMLDGLLIYSRLNTIARSIGKIDCNTLLARCWAQLETETKLLNARLEFADLPQICADPAQIAQLFYHLIDNAVKFRDPNKPVHVRVSATREGKDFLFTFRDDGIGIEEEFYDDIFRIFRKLHADEEYPGRGVGLALARKIVAQHGGKIWVTSVPGQGSVFQFMLPFAASSDV
jgi:light-regulated signal transduction histidine kinase (bacteriophytochrome)